ncbi:aminotransferase class III-fold pyridoxal phosphate-dependent enzyme [uncultured Paracoccus sp.]|uniref:aspartate aminotransferase family protein n=1 Tax=uncultured Paracoccus sp. TaxID=189685 RepID=UPI0025974CF0|nr:aminotransferase class III-fold pyridoxal phosphate-dependent enzyme [uncultured Paracoccus sp.]
MTTQDTALLQRRHQVLGRHALLFYDEPLHLVRAQGVWAEDSAGRKYLDAYNNVPHVGHCHPYVLEAMQRQARLININTRYLHGNVVDYAEKLAATFAPELSLVMPVCTGTEANELALRMARHVTGSRGIIVTDFSYHGNSLALAEATTGLPAPEAPAPHVRAIHVPDMADFEGDPALMRDDYVARVQKAVEELIAAGFPPAALLVDTLFSTEGLPRVPAGFLEGAVAAVRKAGGLYIADEVQPGLGRIGTHMWGHQAFDVVPDIVTMGKSLGNGHPIGAVVTRPDIVENFADAALYFNTYGGNPVSAAIGLAVLEVIEREDLMGNALRVGAHLSERLADLRTRHDCVAHIRGLGLLQGAEFRQPDGTSDGPRTKRIINEMRNQGVLISRIGPNENVLKIRPPLQFSAQDVDVLVDALDISIAKG